MKKLKNCPKTLFFQGLLFLFIVIPNNNIAQNPLEFGIDISLGHTIVNFEKALDYADDYMEDWNQFHIAVRGKCYLRSEGNMQLGAEVGWNKLYYAYYRMPYSTYYIYREYYVSTTSLMLLGKYTMDKFYTAASFGLHIFKDGTSAAIGGEFGYYFSITDYISIPLSLRITPVFGDGTPITVALTFGLTYKTTD